MTAGVVKSAGLAGLLAASLAFTGQAAAQEAAASPSLELELNALEATDSGCRFTFVVSNAMGSDLDKAAYEVALFNSDGMVERLTVLDFRSLPDGKTKVRQFDLSETDCDDIGRVLVNDATACDGEGVEPAACMDRLEATTRTDVEFGT